MSRKVFGSKAHGARLERIKASSRYVDGKFKNTHPVSSGVKAGTAWSTFGEFFLGDQERVPKVALPVENPLPHWATKNETGLRTTWLGHSTVLVELDGATVLTDPVFGLRASPFNFAGPKRFHAPPATIAQLPKLDAVIISHDHYDHLDYPSVIELAKLQVPFFTSLGVGAHLELWGVAPERITELDWWESARVPNTEVQITAAPSQHFSGRGPGMNNSTSWSSFAIRGPKHQVFFSGDTGPTDEYAEIGKRLGKIDLAMLEVGAWHENWGDIHLGPEKALEQMNLLGAKRLLPVHWGTFNLALHAWDDPANVLFDEAPAHGIELVLPKLGAVISPGRDVRADPWWRSLKQSSAAVVQPAPAK